ncbi:helix-turn-helix transcriptional regulator [Helicobacter sp. T3_23-1056]
MQKIQTPFANAKIARQNYIYERLANASKAQQRVSITQLANDLSVSTKTISRDLNENLSQMGAIKIGKGWILDEKYAKDTLNSQEKITISVLDNLAKSVGEVFYHKAHSLLASISSRFSSPIFAHFSAEDLRENDLANFALLESVINDKEQISFIFHAKQYKIEPLKLAFFEGFWYLLGFDISKSNNKTFKKFYLKDISQITRLKTHFEITANIEQRLEKANNVWFSLENPYQVQLLIDKEAAKYFLRKPLKGQQNLGTNPDGSLEITLEITNQMEIIPLILYYIPHIKVLEPEHLRDSVKKIVQQYLSEIS